MTTPANDAAAGDLLYPGTEPYAEPRQQREAFRMGMWLFLASEIMLFGGLFMAVFVVRYVHTAAVREATAHLHLWIGAINTVVLLTSSLTMATAVAAAAYGFRRWVLPSLLVTAGIGLVFLALKGYEYWEEYREGLMPGSGMASPLTEPSQKLFFNLYLIVTGLHAVHLSVAVLLVLTLCGLWRSGRHRGVLQTIEVTGLYWQLVDAIWLVVYPVLYLIR